MAIRFLEGFDGLLSTAQVVRKWGFVNGTPILQASGRNSGGNANLTFGWFFEIPLLIATQTVIIGAAINPIAPRSANADLFEIGARNSSVQIRVRLRSSDDKLEIFRGGAASIGESDTALITGSYTYVEIKAFIDNAVGTVEVKFDGHTVATIGPVNTQGASDAFINSLQVRGDSGGGVRIDDMYVADTSGTFNKDFLGDCRVDTLLATADDVAEFDTVFPASPTTHFSKVDETGGVDEDTTYVETPTNGDRDILEFSNLPVHPEPTQVLAVQPWSYAKKQQGSGDQSVRHLVRPITTIYNQVPQGGNAEDWRVMQEAIIETNPETGLGWMEAEVDAAKFGLEVV